MKLCSRFAQKMDSDGPLFPTQGSLLSVLYFAAWLFGALAAIVILAMILVTARYYLGYDDDEVMVLSTEHPPPAVVGRWQPVTAPIVQRSRITRGSSPSSCATTSS